VCQCVIKSTVLKGMVFLITSLITAVRVDSMTAFSSCREEGKKDLYHMLSLDAVSLFSILVFFPIFD